MIKWFTGSKSSGDIIYIYIYILLIYVYIYIRHPRVYIYIYIGIYIQLFWRAQLLKKKIGKYFFFNFKYLILFQKVLRPMQPGQASSFYLIDFICKCVNILGLKYLLNQILIMSLILAYNHILTKLIILSLQLF